MKITFLQNGSAQMTVMNFQTSAEALWEATTFIPPHTTNNHKIGSVKYDMKKSTPFPLD